MNLYYIKLFVTITIPYHLSSGQCDSVIRSRKRHILKNYHIIHHQSSVINYRLPTTVHLRRRCLFFLFQKSRSLKI